MEKKDKRPRRTQYIVVSTVRKTAKLYGRRIGSSFIAKLDQEIGLWVERACVTKNGGKKTLDATVASYSRGRAA